MDAEDVSASSDSDETSSESSITSSSSESEHNESASSIKELVLFGSTDKSFPNLTDTGTFTNLTTLIIHNQPVPCLTGINTLARLDDLWITECNFRDAATVGACASLKYLHLYSNKITTIPKLQRLKKLELLDLSDNKISSIENLEFLLELRTLYLSDNHIKLIGQSLKENKKLRHLDIAGNPIRSLHDLCQLARNGALESLACTNYTEVSRCPVTLYCNYRSFVVHLLHRLVVLDSFPVTLAERNRVKEFYGKSIVYYNVLHHSYLSDYVTRVTLKQNEDNQMLALMKQAHIKLMLRGTQTTAMNKRLIKKLPGPKQHIQDLAGMVAQWKYHITQWKIKHDIDRKLFEDQLNLELRTVGNLSFQRDVNNTTLLALCQKLMTNFSCENLSSRYIKLDAKVLNAYRVMNNENVIDDSGHQIYLLLAKTFTTRLEVCDWFEHGRHADAECELTTCLANADADWLADHRGWDPTSNREGMRLAVVLKLPSSTCLSNCTGHTQPLSFNTPSSTSILQSTNTTCHTIRTSNPKSIPSICVVEYCYSFDTFIGTGRDLKTTCHRFINGVINYVAITGVNDVTQDVRQKIVKHLKHPEPWNYLDTISLQGLDFDGQFGETTEKFVSAKTLDLSFNNITSLEFLVRWFPNVRDLNVSYNKITSLNTLSGLQDSLINLDLSWNEISSGRSCLHVLSKTNSELECLDLSNNPLVDFKIQDHLVLTASQFLPLLKTINEINIEDFRQSVLVVNLEDEVVSHIDEKQPVELNFCWISNHSKQQMIYTGDNIQDDGRTSMWVSLRDKRVVQLSNLPLNVVRADLSGNLIADLTFLKRWGSVEELSLSRNVITTLGQGILSIQNIAKLDLSENYIKTLDSLLEANLTSLRYLDVSNNKLKNFNGLQNCTALREIYAANNYISTLQDLLEIKQCRQLRVADISGNEVSSLEDFKSYMVFHFRKIEYVNGQNIQENDLQDAFELYGGTLDTDYLLRCNKRTELSRLKHMSIAQCCIKKICLSAELLPCLETLNLEENEICSLIGAHTLPALVSLNLGYNHVNSYLNEMPEDTQQCFPKLKCLYLNNNQIISLDTLKIWSFPSLELLFLQGNQLVNIRGVEKVNSLKYLLIDRNKIHSLTPEDCLPLENIEELYMEGNKIRDLTFLKSVPNLTKLFVGHNKINDHEQLRNLSALNQLRDLTLLGNPFCRVFHHYRQAIAHVPTLETLDGLPLDITAFI